MAETFASLYSLTRAALGDYGSLRGGATVDSDTYLYRDDMLDGAMSLALLSFGDYSESASSITPDFVSDTWKKYFIYTVAVGLLSAETDMADSMMGGTLRKKQRKNLLDLAVIQLLSARDTVDAGRASDMAIAAIINANTRYSDAVEAATT